MEQIRTRFLEKQLGLPSDIISIIRKYDTIYLDLYSKKIVKNINKKVRDFWQNKLMNYLERLQNQFDTNYYTKIQNYYTIWFDVVPLYIDYNDENSGLLIFD